MAPRKQPPTRPEPASDGPDAKVVPLGVARRDARARAAHPGYQRVVQEIPLERLEPDSANVRGTLRGIDELAASIAENGVLEPLLVTPIGDDRWQILAGHRRRAAATAAGLATVPCLEHTSTGIDDQARVVLQLVENLQRDDLTPIEEARAYAELVDAGESQRTIAARVGRHQSHISKRLKLLTLTDRAQELVATGELSVPDALELTRLAEHPERLAAALAATRDDDPWNRPDTMSEAVDDQLRVLEREQARLAAFAELDAAGIRVVDWPASGSYGDSGWPAGHRRIDQPWKWPSGKAPTKARLAKAGHLAAAVDERGNVVYLCTDAARYQATPGGKNTTGGTVDDEARKAETRARTRRLRSDRRRRLAVAGRYVRTHISADRRAELVATSELSKAEVIFVTSVLDRWLGDVGHVRAAATKTALEVLDVDAGTTLHRLAEQPEFAGRVELATWVALAEESIEQRQLIDHRVTAYYRWLDVLGYQLGPEEHHDLEDALAQARSRVS